MSSSYTPYGRSFPSLPATCAPGPKGLIVFHDSCPGQLRFVHLEPGSVPRGAGGRGPGRSERRGIGGGDSGHGSRDGSSCRRGPCTPREAGVSVELIRTLGPSTPLLGVCLGHQAIGEAFGGRTIPAGQDHARQDCPGPPHWGGYIPGASGAPYGGPVPFPGDRSGLPPRGTPRSWPGPTRRNSGRRFRDCGTPLTRFGVSSSTPNPFFPRVARSF